MLCSDTDDIPGCLRQMWQWYSFTLVSKNNLHIVDLMTFKVNAIHT